MRRQAGRARSYRGDQPLDGRVGDIHVLVLAEAADADPTDDGPIDDDGQATGPSASAAESLSGSTLPGETQMARPAVVAVTGAAFAVRQLLNSLRLNV